MINEIGLPMVIQKFTFLLGKGKKFSNFDLQKLYAEENFKILNTIDFHFMHELLEVAINKTIEQTNYGNITKNEQQEREILYELDTLENLIPVQAWRSENQQRLQQFSTPPKIAFLLTRILNPRRGELVLEPSAGTGSLAVWLRLAGAELHLNEISERRRLLLTIQEYTVTGFDAAYIDDLLPKEIEPDAVLMNPPFTASPGRTDKRDSKYGFRHVRSALGRLKSGGRLVALLGGPTLTKTDRGINFLKEIEKEYDLRAVINLPGKAYYKYGTSYPTSIICIKKGREVGPLKMEGPKIFGTNCREIEEALEFKDIFD